MPSYLRILTVFSLISATALIGGCDIAPKTPRLDGNRSHHEKTPEGPRRDQTLPLPSHTSLAPETGQTDKLVDRAKRPNILLIVADDMGYTDIGAFGSEIRTPNLDALAKNGVKFNNFHSAPVCAVARSEILSGTDSHLAGVGDQFPSGAQVGKPGYEGYLSKNVVALPKILSDAGYHTYMAGKWHLGLAADNSPHARGFESSFALLYGAASHMDMMGPGAPEATIAKYRHNGQPAEPPKGFFSTNFYTDQLIADIKAHQGDGKPFFAYAAYTSPHWPLQAPDDFIDRYKGRYDMGYDKLRAKRIAAAEKAGALPTNLDVSRYDSTAKPWSSLDEQEKQEFSRRMEVYAAMVENLDYNVGRLVTYLRQNGLLDNTLIFFLSDNGAQAGMVENSPRARDWLKKVADNSLKNIGRKGSFVSYGTGWASASEAPFRYFKAFTTEGGIHVPAFVNYRDLAHKGSWNPNFLTIQDLTPTFLELAHAPHPASADHKVEPLRGKSMVAELIEGRGPTHSANDPVGWEFHGGKAMIQGKWKLVYITGPRVRRDKWELYDLSTDLTETHDLADKMPKKRDEMVALYKAYAAEVGAVPFVPGPMGQGPGSSPHPDH